MTLTIDIPSTDLSQYPTAPCSYLRYECGYCERLFYPVRPIDHVAEGAVLKTEGSFLKRRLLDHKGHQQKAMILAVCLECSRKIISDLQLK